MTHSCGKFLTNFFSSFYQASLLLTASENIPELLPPPSKLQLLIWQADSYYEQKEWRKAEVCKYLLIQGSTHFNQAYQLSVYISELLPEGLAVEEIVAEKQGQITSISFGEGLEQTHRDQYRILYRNACIYQTNDFFLGTFVRH